MKLTWTQFELLKNLLMAIPFLTTMGGALFGYLEGQEIGHNVLATVRGTPLHLITDEPAWNEVLINMVIGAGLGLTGGIALCCFGMVATHHIKVVNVPVKRQKRGKGGSKFSHTNFKTYFKKQDVEENERSTQRVSEKYDKKRKEQEAEAKEILEIGTVGIREKKFGKKNTNKNANVKKKGK